MKKPKAPKKKTKLTEEESHPIRQALHEILTSEGNSTLFADGFEDAIVGMSLGSPGRPTLVVYDLQKCESILMKRDKMSHEEANEFLDFNTVGAWAGDMTPIFMDTTKTILGMNGMEHLLKKPKKAKKADPRQMRLL